MTKNNVLYEIFAACQTYFMAFQLFVSTYPTYSKRNSHEIRPIVSLSMNLWRVTTAKRIHFIEEHRILLGSTIISY